MNANGDHYQDLEQEILFALWHSLDRYQARSSPKTWSYGVATTTVSKFSRKDRRTVRATGLNVCEEPATYSNGQNRDEFALLDKFTHSVGELDRIIFLMFLDNVSRWSSLQQFSFRQSPCRDIHRMPPVFFLKDTGRKLAHLERERRTVIAGRGEKLRVVLLTPAGRRLLLGRQRQNGDCGDLRFYSDLKKPG
jgi:hypothetical protein